MRILFAVFWIFGLWSFRARAREAIPDAVSPPVKTAHVTAQLVAEKVWLVPGQSNRIGLRMQMIPHWHTYWRFPGDSGLPTEINWHLPEGWKAGPLEWPIPKRIFVPPLVNYGYETEALIAAPITVPAGVGGSFPISASVSWLVCKEECVPEKAELSFRMQVGPAQAGPYAREFGLLGEDQTRAKFARSASVLFKDKLVGLVVPDPHGEIAQGADFLPTKAMLLKGDAPPKVEHKDGKAILWLEKSDPFDTTATELTGVLVQPVNGPARVSEVTAKLMPSAPGGGDASAPAEESPPWLLVGFALLGGLILNLMPCVFPVLGIKVMSLVRQGGGNRSHARGHGLAYAAGVVVCFWSLAGLLLVLRSAGQSIGWGFQLQQPIFVTTLILLFTFVAADLAGFIHWSGRWMGAGSELAEKEGHAGSFFTGVLAVVVATPCSAPFMGTAIGAAISEPSWVIFLVFTALGFGLAAPFVFLCYQPAALGMLPRPGAWMERLKELFAFPIVATVLWLLWVLTMQIGADGAFKVELGMLVMMISVWARRRFQGARGAQAVSHVMLLLGVLLCIFGAKTEITPVASHGAWKPYDEAVLEKALDEGKPVFVDFTAAWCLTCQVNKKLVLDRAAMQAYFQEKGVTLFLADWTNRDATIAKALERQGRIGVPLYLAYHAGSRTPEVLPQILTEDRLRSTFP